MSRPSKKDLATARKLILLAQETIGEVEDDGSWFMDEVMCINQEIESSIEAIDRALHEVAE